jgi:hypothetical protein
MATSFCRAVQIPSLLDTVPESLQISTIMNANDGAAAPLRHASIQGDLLRAG